MSNSLFEKVKPTEDELFQKQVELERMKILREIQRENAEKDKRKRGWFDSMFPELSGLPLFWGIIAVICIAFSLFTMILI